MPALKKNITAFSITPDSTTGWTADLMAVRVSIVGKLDI
jgi:hypothetical protein